jgi:hypothetical protein
VKRLLLFVLLLSCSEDERGACVKEGVCCPPTAANGMSCGMIRAYCGLDPQGSCTCGMDYKWHCFGVEDMAVRLHLDLRGQD